LKQADVYIKQHPQDAALTSAELIQMIKSGGEGAAAILKRMHTYAANLTGSDAYWYARRCELEAIFEQAGTGTVFFTFSFADNHWRCLHE
jgi:hypothetical protein